MMENLPAHMRIAILNPSNDDVNARRAAIEELTESWKEVTDVATILTKVEMIARSLGGDGTPAEELGMEVQQALQKHASAFLYEESLLDVGVCAGMAALSVLAPTPDKHGWMVADVYSNALWSALAFQPQLPDDKRERLRREVLARARDRSRESAESARERSAVPDLGDLVVTIPESGKPTTNFRRATFATIEALRRNALLDREEIDFLWWIQLNRSRLLKRKIDAMPEPLRLVSLAVEAVGHLRRLPADLHYELVLRGVDEDPELDLSALLKAIGSDRATLAAGFDAPRAERNPGVFPLLHAIASGNAKIPGAKVKRSASIWAGQALLEAGLMRMIGNGLPKS